MYGHHPTTPFDVPYFTPIENISRIHQNIFQNLKLCQERMTKTMNVHHCPNPNFCVGTWVWLSSKFFYPSALPPSTSQSVHPVFHISLLKFAHNVESHLQGGNVRPRCTRASQ
ncbi:hypothetical protein HMI56_001749 [Coelomomyces lativittatus]|nr:hypothetical protein HMI56_001749 [Coelomomyces lativittatus]